MNRAFLSCSVFCLILIGGSAAMAQESRATQTVSFAVSRTAAFSLQERFGLRETITESLAKKVTVLLDQGTTNSARKRFSTSVPKSHMDIAAVHSTDMHNVPKGKPILLTVTD